MTGRISDHLVERWLKNLDGAWFSLHHDNPDISGAYASEVFGGGYARSKSMMTPPANRATWNGQPLLFQSLPSVVITHVGLWDAQENGNMLASVALDQQIIVVASKTLSIGIREIAVSIQ